MMRIHQTSCVPDRFPWAFQSGPVRLLRTQCFKRTFRCSNSADAEYSTGISRRDIFSIASALYTGTFIEFLHGKPSMALPASKGQTPTVGSYLPSAGVEDFVEFVPGPQKTPVSFLSLREHTGLQHGAQHQTAIKQWRGCGDSSNPWILVIR
jgi:hypothetical protein